VPAPPGHLHPHSPNTHAPPPPLHLPTPQTPHPHAQESWPGWDKLKESRLLTFKPEEPRLRERFRGGFIGSIPLLSEAGVDLLSRLLEMNPGRRISAEAALQHKWFAEAPRPVSQVLMPAFTPRHQQQHDGK
jgi:cell division cycle 2-like protein